MPAARPPVSCGKQTALEGDAEDGESVTAVLIHLAGAIWTGHIRFHCPWSGPSTLDTLGYGAAAPEHWSSRVAALDAASGKAGRPMDWADYTFNAVRCPLVVQYAR